MKHETNFAAFFQSLLITLVFVGTLWLVTGIETLARLDFGFLGILPRSAEGALGIFTGPLVHGSLAHLYSNSVPLALLCFGLFYLHSRIGLEVFLIIYFFSGLFVWISARDAYHIGSSGIVYGLVAFLFFMGVLARDYRSVLLAVLVVVFYGGMFYGLVPSDGDLSWESHLFGALTGLFCAFYFFKKKSRAAAREMRRRAAVPSRPILKSPFSPEKMTHTHSDQAEVSYFYKEAKKGGRRPSRA